MAILEENGRSHEGWVIWSLELMQRGLRPVDSVQVHGPHEHPADYVWGRAACEIVGRNSIVSTVFHTSEGVRSIYDLGTLRVFSESTDTEFPILPSNSLPQRLKMEMAEFSAERERVKRRDWLAYAGHGWRLMDVAKISITGGCKR
jgi:hypothetical protein